MATVDINVDVDADTDADVSKSELALSLNLRLGELLRLWQFQINASIIESCTMLSEGSEERPTLPASYCNCELLDLT